jgi:DNA-binding NtrC family response regulator
MRTILCISNGCAAKADVCGLLERAGFRVIREDSIHSGLFLLASGVRVQLVVLDLRDAASNDNNGLRSVKRIVPHIPVIVLSPGCSVLKYMHARYLGACEYLQMPVSDRDLLYIVQTATTVPGGKPLLASGSGETTCACYRQ